MKRNLLIVLSAIIGIIVVSGFATMSPTGAPPAKTGSPGDGSNCTECHGGTPTTTPGLITSNIPAAGYTAGQTYQITATNNLTGNGKFGFEVSPQNAAGTQLGTLAAGAGSKLVGGTKYVTHSNANETTSSWTFNWTAPASGTGQVTFYGAFARNKPGPVTLSTLVVQEALALPGAAGPISGPASVCKNNTETYSVGPIAGATSYTWSVPSGATIQSGQGTTSISVLFGNSASSGNVSVFGSNGAGNGPASNLAVSVKSVPAAAGAIAGNNAPCESSTQSYSVNNVSGVTYTWTVPAGWNIVSGQGSNAINVVAGAMGGNLTVLPSNTCGSGLSSSITVSVGLTAQTPTSPEGPTEVDLLNVTTSEYTSMSANASSYLWQIAPAEAGTINGSTSTATVTWNSTFTGTASISAKAINECGQSNWSTVTTTQVINTTSVDEQKQEIVIMPSIKSSSFMLILTTQFDQCKVNLLDISGRRIASYLYPGQGTYTVTSNTPIKAGLYIVVVEAGAKTHSQKIVIR